MNASPVDSLLVQLDEYKRKYYANLLLKGVIFSAAVVLSAYLLFNTLEYFGHFGKTFRTLLFFGFLGVFLSSMLFWVIKPLIFLYGRKKPLSNEEAARQIGRFFPEVGDRLLNTLQLVSQSQSDLIQASIRQKSQQLAIVKFTDAVKLEENRKHLKYAAVPAVVIAAILFVFPQFFTKPTTRLVQFRNEFAEEAPFSFFLENKSLQAFRNEDLVVEMTLKGNAVPEAVYLNVAGRRFKMESSDLRHYSYTFRKLQQDFDFTFEAAGYFSPSYDVDIVARPSLTGFDVSLQYPSYLNKPAETLKNTGNLTVPEGTVVEWQFSATETDAVSLSFSGKPEPAEKSMLGGFHLEKKVRTSGEYQVSLQNKYASNLEPVSFFLNVIPDKYPGITLEQYRDSTLYNYLVLGGNISDDYGISNLRLFYRIIRENDTPKSYASLGIPFSKGQTIQSFYYQWATDSLRLAPGDKIEYYVQVWDNDGVNGAKSAKTGLMNYAVPSKKVIEKEIENAVEKTENQLDRSLSKAQQLKKELAALEARLRNKRDLDYQDKKQLEELIKKREQLQEELRQLQEQNMSLTQKQQRFNEQRPELAQKFEQLQKLMDELLKSDSDKLYEQLKQMLEKNQDERLLEMLDRMKAKERNTEKDLDRAMQLFKRLQREQKLEKSIDELKKLAEEQQKLAEKTDQQKDTAPKDTKDAKKNEADSLKNAQKDAKKNESDSLKNDGKNNEQKDGKDNKDGKDSKDGKENKDGKDSKDDNKGEDSKDQKDSNSLENEQQKLQDEMEDIKKNLNDVENLNNELKDMQEKDMGKKEQQEISEQQQQSQQDMKSGKNRSSSQRQKKAAQQMKQLAQKLSDMKQQAEMEENEENMDDLRDILENLVRLSFDQERLMKDFRGVQLADPRFVKLAQEQIKLQDDARIVEDSLYALAKRVLQIQAFVTREVGDMKKNMDDAARFIRERKLPMATSKQQFAMTNINNLALMLSDVLKQMQENAMSMMSASQKGKKSKRQPGNKPSMGKQQEQMNQQMQQSQQGQRNGRAYSEQLAKMAAEQAAIRKQLQEAMDKLRGTEAGKKMQGELNELMKKMDQTEEDLVNKRVTPNTINRNKEILTRLLESEKAMQEQEEEQKRKGETAKEQPRRVPPAFEQYVKEKQKQTELLRTVPPSLSPFYKKEVDQYFRKLK
ncbi:DUF4175 family protein [Siphonobacter aquaeclarae]|uniref:ATPase n=1 Tax=Siphonobacter aquaeclarae TaxID=563176 RepID=A0A1G9M8J8_9BACT|nr:DUF4175 family protein [Siphonobacter aquaeclarae]SDL70600.1 protein of unknown function [Siphonobacter aquaeclarae]